jgi:hypothetical protein
VPSSAAAHVHARNIISSCLCAQSRPFAFSSAAAASVFALACCSRSSCSLQQQLFFCAAANVICDLACCSGCPCSFLKQQWPVLLLSSAAALVLVFNLTCPGSCGQSRRLSPLAAVAASVGLVCCSCSYWSLQQQRLVCAAANAICDSASISGCPCLLLQQRWPVLVPSSAAALGLARNINSPRPCVQPRQLASSSAAAASVSVLACCFLATIFLCRVQSRPFAFSSAAAASVFALACCSRSSCSLQQQLFFCAAANVICDLACCSGFPCSFLKQQWLVLLLSSAAALVLVFNLTLRSVTSARLLECSCSLLCPCFLQ